MDPFSLVVGGASILGGLFGTSKQSKATEKAAKLQAEAQKEATALGKEQLQFQMQQYQDWQDVFGDFQETLAGYYKNLSPDVMSAMNVQGIQEEYQRGQQNLKKQLAMQGITHSGTMAESLALLEAERARDTASARFQAPQQVAQQQASFLGLGLGQQGPLQQGIAGSYQQLSQLSQQQAGVYGQQAAMAGQGMASSLGAIGQGAGLLASSFGTVQTPSSQYMQYQNTQMPSVFNTIPPQNNLNLLGFGS
jgi:hypothetical protein